LALLAPVSSTAAPVLAPTYSGSYSLVSLGSVPGLPPLYGGLTFLDNNTLLIGGNANTAAGRLYTIDVVRDGSNQITGFSGTATVFGSVGDFNDGGVVFGPGGVLFTAQWPVNMLGQTLPGSTDEDRVDDLDPLGVVPSPGGLMFVPDSHPGAGELKLVSWAGGQWYTLDLAPDGSGTFDILSATLETTIAGGPEGIAYVPLGSALFPNPSVLVSEYSAGNVAVYEVDANGDPIVATRVTFISGLTGAEGAVIDPLTGDFLFSTFGGGNQIIRVSGFEAPNPDGAEGPEPATFALLGLGLTASLWRRRRP
jgi:hypothetical protein